MALIPASRPHRMRFDPTQSKTFFFHSYEYDDLTGEARFHYSLDRKIRFTEVIRFAGANSSLDGPQREALQRGLRFLHLAAGISYFKAAVPGAIVVEGPPLSLSAARFFEHLYVHGLGEFAFENDLNLVGRISFPFSASAEDPASNIALPNAVAVPIGGGKDSLVTVELLRESGQPLTLVSVGNQELSRALAREARLPLIMIQRRIARSLLELNRAGAYNGHVPITAILSFVFAAASIVYGFDTLVMSNERSANVGNVIREDGFEVNHQYSKSLEFEKRFSQFIEDHLLTNLRYFSLMRPLSELAIAERFSTLRRYHGSFTSCNQNFRVNGASGARWCLHCPKCRFVFLSLAPFMPKEELLAIFGHNLLDDERQYAGFDALCGFGQQKPFECVGEIEESRAAMILLSRKKEWKHDHVIRRFVETRLPAIDAPQALVDHVMTASPEHRVPAHYLEYLFGRSEA